MLTHVELTPRHPPLARRPQESPSDHIAAAVYQANVPSHQFRSHFVCGTGGIPIGCPRWSRRKIATAWTRWQLALFFEDEQITAYRYESGTDEDPSINGSCPSI
jgi:hypothetical protein